MYLRPFVLICLLLSGMGAAAQVGEPWREAPAYLPLFAPAGARGSAYRAFVSSFDLETTLQRLQSDASLVHAAAAWQPRPVLPLDAFGQAGRYDRSALTRVYGAQHPRVARGARMENGRVVESWTLIAPYPDPELKRLEAGTLLLVLRLP